MMHEKHSKDPYVPSMTPQAIYQDMLVIGQSHKSSLNSMDKNKYTLNRSRNSEASKNLQSQKNVILPSLGNNDSYKIQEQLARHQKSFRPELHNYDNRYIRNIGLHGLNRGRN